MEYRITQLRADTATGHVVSANWRLTHEDGGFEVSCYGSVLVTDLPTPLVFAGLDEGVAIERVKDMLGTEATDALEQGLIDQIVALQNPTFIEGLPWELPVLPAPPAPESTPPAS